MTMKLSDPSLIQSALDNGIYTAAVLRPDKARSCFQMMRSMQFEFHTLEEVEKLSSYLANFFPEPDRVLRGIAELMINAIEHGNLEIGYDSKAELCRRGLWQSEIEQRLSSANYSDRIAEVALTRKDGGIYIVISDQGRGFDWKSHLKINPARATETHGRGIAMANSISFDKLTYNDAGNKAVAYVADTSHFDW